MDQNTPPLPSSSTSAPLLLRRPLATSRLNSLASFLSRAIGPRGTPALVRDAAALHLERRRADWAYSRPIVALDIAWNLAFAAAALVVVATTGREQPNVPLRVWIAGYALQCVVHVVLVWGEYRRRVSVGSGSRSEEERAVAERSDTDGEDNDEVGVRQSRIVKRCESVNTMASFLWWLIGFYWILSGGEALAQDAPRLYWLSVVFIAFDVVFAIFCVVLACVIGIALCCCLPCIIAILYAVAGQEGASDADISILPRYKYVDPQENGRKTSAGAGTMIPLTTNNGGSSVERTLLPEDAYSSNWSEDNSSYMYNRSPVHSTMHSSQCYSAIAMLECYTATLRDNTTVCYSAIKDFVIFSGYKFERFGI